MPTAPLTTPQAAATGEVLKHTSSLCPQCLGMLPATLEVFEGDVWMRKTCPEHGEFFTHYWRDAVFFREADRRIHTHTICHEPVCAKGEICHDHWDRSTTLMINVTERCNYDCPVCFSETNLPHREDMTLERLKTLLPKPKPGHTPNLVFVGGEPTVHAGLPEMLRYCTELGYLSRLVTNGSRLLKPGYLQTLHGAGLRWVVLQFDGFSEEVHQKLRKRNDLMPMKEAIFKAVNGAGMRLQLATMVKKDVNLREVAKIVRFGLKSNDTFWCSTYPHSSIHKNQTPQHSTHVIDVMEALEDDLDGQVTRWDFLESMDLFRRLAVLRRDEHLTQKLSIYPIVLFQQGDRIVPVNRLATLGGAVKHRALAWEILKNLKAFLNFETSTLPRGCLFFTIEKFHNDDSIDLEEASQCHMAYLTERGLVPFDIFNTYYRRRFGL